MDGIDVFFIGPSDLSQTYGHPGNPKAEPVAKAIDDTLSKIVAAGKAPGLPAAAEAVETVIGKGALYIYTHVPRLLGAAAADYFRAAKKDG